MRFEFQINLKPIQEKASRIEKTKVPALRQSLVLAYQVQALLDQEKIKSLSEAAKWLNLCNARVSQILNLLTLAPNIQSEILIRDDIRELTEFQIRKISMELDWKKQREMWARL